MQKIEIIGLGEVVVDWVAGVSEATIRSRYKELVKIIKI